MQADARSSHAQAWAPAITYLQRHLALGARVEAVPTSARWEAYYLPARGIPLARGWFRQTDLARNGILYARTLSGAAYRAWLGGTAVQYVLLTPPFPLDDHGATAEARLLRSRLSGLRVVWRRAGFTIYAAQHPARLMTGTVGARLTVFTHARIAGTCDVPAPQRSRCASRRSGGRAEPQDVSCAAATECPSCTLRAAAPSRFRSPMTRSRLPGVSPTPTAERTWSLPQFSRAFLQARRARSGAVQESSPILEAWSPTRPHESA